MKRYLRLALLAPLLAALAVLSTQQIFAKDQWTQVRSQNFLLIGNASEKEIRLVGTRLEQFRETFRQAYRGMTVSSAIPTNVVVFKNAASFKNFKPKRSGGRIDEWVAGYFQAGEAVNYIALSMHGTDEQVFGTIFHEFVHNLVNTNFGKTEVPAWFNEGLAEYYQTFEIKDDQIATIGRFQQGHLWLLRDNKLMPLDELFNVSNQQLGESGNHSRSIFYAQSWALMHYLLQNNKTQPLNAFLKALRSGIAPRQAFQDAFQMSYEQMELELRNYVKLRRYNAHKVTFANKLVFDSEMTAQPLSEAATQSYLGDLLYHINQWDDAEPFLKNALRLDPNSEIANTAMGMVKLRQDKLDEAKPFLERAVTGDSKNFNALYRYAYLLSREARAENGLVSEIDAANAAKIRDALKKAIRLNPAFTPSYELLAFVHLVTDQGLDEAAALLRTALKYNAGDQRSMVRLGEVLSRQGKLDESGEIAKKLAASSTDPEVVMRANHLLGYLKHLREMNERVAAESRPDATGRPPRVREERDTPPTEAEAAKIAADARIRSLNRSLRKPAAEENRVIGRIQQIECTGKGIRFLVKTAETAFTLVSPDFQNVNMHAFIDVGEKNQVGCGENLAAFNAVITYRPGPRPKPPLRGALVSIEFVPADFRILSPDEMTAVPYIVHKQTTGQ